MTNLDIRINVKKLMDYSESLKPHLKEETLLMMIESFAYYILRLYVSMIEESIYSNRYKGKWEPVEDEGYREYLGTDPKGDILTLIFESLEVEKIGYNFVVSIEPHYKYPGTELPLVRVLRAIDSGTSKFNARPIFSRIISQINSHLLSLWRGYLKKKGVT